MSNMRNYLFGIALGLVLGNVLENLPATSYWTIWFVFLMLGLMTFLYEAFKALRRR